jgi:hypothetical protein
MKVMAGMISPEMNCAPKLDAVPAAFLLVRLFRPGEVQHGNPATRRRRIPAGALDERRADVCGDAGKGREYRLLRARVANVWGIELRKAKETT